MSMKAAANTGPSSANINDNAAADTPMENASNNAENSKTLMILQY